MPVPLTGNHGKGSNGTNNFSIYDKSINTVKCKFYLMICNNKLVISG